MGRHTAVAGQVITASAYNTYVRDQVISTFATESTRTSAIVSPTEGMWSDIADIDALCRHSGTAWERWLYKPLFAYRDADSTAKTSDTALAPDTQLTLPVPANTILTGHACLMPSGGDGDFKMAWAFPTNARISIAPLGPHNLWSSAAALEMELDATQNQTSSPSTALTYGALGFGPTIHVDLFVQVGNTAGDITLQWAQGTSHATGTVLLKDSWLALDRRL